MIQKYILLLAMLVLLSLLAPSAYAQQRTLTPNMRVHVLNSKIMGQDRHVLVALPPNYARETRRYPTFYMNDGQNKYLNWRIDEIAEKLIVANEIEPLILVGVYHGGTHDDRFSDYTPTVNPNYKKSGKADVYGRMLVEELKPFIDSQYRTLPDAANTGLGGASLGGLVSLYLGLKYPNVFGKLAVMSPSIWWDNRFIINEVKKLKLKPALRIWLDAGTNEDRTDDLRKLRDGLKEKGWVVDSDLGYLEVKGGEHNEAAFAARADKVLKYLYPPVQNRER